MFLKEPSTGIEEKFEHLAQSVLPDLGLSLYDVDYRPSAKLLRVFIFNKDTGTAVIEDCVRVDRALTGPIEELDWIPAELTLEVSSPGMFRSLHRRSHLEQAIGDKIKVTLFKSDSSDAIAKSGVVRGVLHSVGEDFLELAIEGAAGQAKILFEEVKKAQVDPDIKSL